MFDLSEKELVLWEQLEDLKQQLDRIASQPITASPELRDELLRKSLTWVRQNLCAFPASGYYLETSQGYFFDAGLNATIADYLLAADRVFYDGELRFYAIRIIENLVANYWQADNKSFALSGQFNQHKSPHLLPLNLANQVLDLDEKRLLLTLCEAEALGEERLLPLYYRISLKAAAKKLSLAIKQVQILQASMEQKLIATGYYETPVTSDSKLSDFKQQDPSPISRTITHAIVWHDAIQLEPMLVSFRNQLLQQLQFIEPNDLNISLNALISLADAVLDSLQANFDHQILSSICDCFYSFPPIKPQMLSHQSLKQLAEIKAILIHFNQKLEGDFWLSCDFVEAAEQLQLLNLPASSDKVAIKQSFQAGYQSRLKLFPTINLEH